MWQSFGKQLASGIQVEHAHCEISKAELLGLLTKIRSRLLDFVLELESKLPNNPSEQDVRQSPNRFILLISSNAMFSTDGGSLL
jgi:hypothetical protein